MYQHGDMDTALIGIAFAHQIMIAQQLPVIRGKKDHVVFSGALCVQCIQKAAYLMIYEGNTCIIAGLLLQFKFRIGRSKMGIVGSALNSRILWIPVPFTGGRSGRFR